MAYTTDADCLYGQIGLLALLRALGAERIVAFTSSVESTQRCSPWRLQGQKVFHLMIALRARGAGRCFCVEASRLLHR